MPRPLHEHDRTCGWAAEDRTAGALAALPHVFPVLRRSGEHRDSGDEHPGELGLSNTQLGLVFSAFAYPYAFFQIFGGWIGDRLGPRLTLLACGLIVSATTMLTGLAGGLFSLFTVRMALGFGEGAAFPTATRAMASWLTAESWGFAQGITHSAARLGNALTPPLIAALIVMLSWRASFLILGADSLVWVVIRAFYFRDAPEPAPADTIRSVPTPWRKLILRMLPVTAVDFCYGWMLWLFLNWLPSFFQDEYHQDLKKSAIFSAGVFLAGVVGDTLRRHFKRPDSQTHRKPPLRPGPGDRRRIAGCFRVHAAIVRLPRRRSSRGLAGTRLLLAGVRGGADLVGADGHRTQPRRQGQRADEPWIRHRRDHFTYRGRHDHRRVG